MILEPTVFVLGAGASAPYGFPVGSDLAKKVCEGFPHRDQDRRLSHPPLISQVLEVFAGSHKDLSDTLAEEFRRAYGDAGCSSLDEFVEAKDNRRFLPLAKAAIICSIVQCENDGSLYPDANRPALPNGEMPKNVDWLEYLFKQLKDEGNSDPNRFRLNRVRVITFNFDRSFERKLFRMLRASYGVSDAFATDLRRCIEVLHVHGRIGAEKWCEPCEEGATRSYVSKAKAGDLQSLFHDIRIVHEDVQSEVLDRAQGWLADAKTVCFLGFGFNKTNLNRLRVREIGSGTRVMGTAFGLSIPEITRVENRFERQGPRVVLQDKTSYDFLRHTDVLQVE